MSGQIERTPVRLAELPGMTLAQLRAVWGELMTHAHGRKRIASPPPGQRSLLIREIAWRLQERDLPDRAMDPDTQRLLNAAVRDATSGRLALDIALPAAGRTRSRIAPATPRNRLATASALPSMSRLIRVFRGVKHEVTVLDGGNPPGPGPRFRYRFRGRDYRSLSAIAKEITGTVWSGPHFFGLTTHGVVDHADPTGENT